MAGPGNMDESPQLNHNVAHEAPTGKPPPRKRRRLVISCTECHRRKQKCDRQLPCTNCQTRNKESACRYETGKPLTKDDTKPPSAGQSPEGLSPPNVPPAAAPPENGVNKTVNFGYTENNSSTLGILKRIDDPSSLGGGVAMAEAGEANSIALRENYKALIRQLPARTYVEKLVDVYLREVNWMYFGIDEALLRDLMDQWYELPFSVLSSGGPQALAPLLRALPALLFQIMSAALLYLPEGMGEEFDSLKYANMTFGDLAQDYSESGVSCVNLLGKRQMSIITVLAGWVRAGFLKYRGMVTEAWHQVGTSIRDAQEIGLHRDQADPQAKPGDPMETMFENLWMAQVRRRIWVTLLGWDLHTAAVLGRPASVDFRQLNRTMPIDVLISKDRGKGPLIPRSEHDPPTPLTRSIWAFEMMRPMREVLDLEKEGPFPKDFSRVDKIHKDLMELQSRTPGPFRLENPDTRFDELPECWWLPYARHTLPQLTSFSLMALHRPYIFTRAISRYEALKASLDMLHCQQLSFESMKPHQFKAFSLFFGTFDAIVMNASIYILFPKENPDMLQQTSQHFEWGLERFEKMSGRNDLAKAALGVLRAVYLRFKKAVDNANVDFLSLTSKISPAILGNQKHHSHNQSQKQNDETPTSNSGETPASSSAPTGTTISGEYESSNRPPGSIRSSQADVTPQTDVTTPQTTTTAGDSTGTTYAEADVSSFPIDFDFGSLMPMYPMADIAYNDLTGVLGSGNAATTNGGTSSLWGNSGHPLTSSSSAMAADREVDQQQQHHHHHQHQHRAANANFSGVNGAGAAATPDEALDPSLMGGGGGGGGGSDVNAQDASWQFGGDFGNDSIWNLLNQFPPY